MISMYHAKWSHRDCQKEQDKRGSEFKIAWQLRRIWKSITIKYIWNLCIDNAYAVLISIRIRSFTDMFHWRNDIYFFFHAKLKKKVFCSTCKSTPKYNNNTLTDKLFYGEGCSSEKGEGRIMVTAAADDI